MRSFIIAEAGVNHNGSYELASKLVEIAHNAGADAIKFQTFKAEKLARPGAAKAKYQEEQTGAGDQFSMLKALELNAEDHQKLMRDCNHLGIEFMSTPFDEESADFLIKLGMKRIKIPSGEITNHPFLAYLARFNVPLILSTGMADLNEVKEAVHVIQQTRLQEGFKEDLASILTILHCTSNYPTKPSDVNLKAMLTLGQAIGCPIGYSDHTQGIHIANAAIAFGATVIEKHFTIDRNLPGPDHKASLEPRELKEMIAAIRDIEAAFGNGEKKPRESELAVRELVRKSVTAIQDLKKDEILTKEKIALLRPGNGIPPKEFEAVIGKKITTDIPMGTTLQWKDIA